MLLFSARFGLVSLFQLQPLSIFVKSTPLFAAPPLQSLVNLAPSNTLDPILVILTQAMSTTHNTLMPQLICVQAPLFLIPP